MTNAAPSSAKWATCNRQLSRGDIDYSHVLSRSDHNPRHGIHDTTPSAQMSHYGEHSVLRKRGAFTALPVKFENDLVHGSWWFVYGSVLATIAAFIPLVSQIIVAYEDSTIHARQTCSTWLLLVLSGICFTLGSYAFVRVFSEPPPPPLLHCALLKADFTGAIFFSLGTAPYIPYFLLLKAQQPHNKLYIGGLLLSSVGFGCTLLFAGTFIPPFNREQSHYIRLIFQRILGPQHWLIAHVQTDWLGGSWAVFIATTEACVLSLGLLVYTALFAWSAEDLLLYAVSCVDALLFTIGSAYFVAGSYPFDIMQCYRFGGGQASGSWGTAGALLLPHEIDMQTGLIDDL